MNTIVPIESFTSLASIAFAWLLGLILWFGALIPFVALVEYIAHRWIMHRSNRWLDPKRVQLAAHAAHHAGANSGEFVDIPLRNCLLLATPVLLVLAVWALVFGSWSAVILPVAAMLAWCFIYTYLWSSLHRAIHGLGKSWFARSGPVFRFYRNHHLRHHVNANVNFGTLFPWTDYVFFTWRSRKPILEPRIRQQQARIDVEPTDHDEGAQN